MVPQPCSAQAGLIAEAAGLLIEKVGPEILEKIGGEGLSAILSAGSDVAVIKAIKETFDSYSENFDGYKQDLLNEYNVVSPTVSNSYYLTSIADVYISISKDCMRVTNYINNLDWSKFSPELIYVISDMIASMRDISQEVKFVKETVIMPGNYTSYERISMLADAQKHVLEKRDKFYEVLNGAINGGVLDPKLAMISDSAKSMSNYFGF